MRWNRKEVGWQISGLTNRNHIRLYTFNGSDTTADVTGILRVTITANYKVTLNLAGGQLGSTSAGSYNLARPGYQMEYWDYYYS